MTLEMTHDVVGDINEPHLAMQFNTLRVYRRRADGAHFYAIDSGCSCPVPFENTTEADLRPYDEQTVRAWAQKVGADPSSVIRLVMREVEDARTRTILGYRVRFLGENQNDWYWSWTPDWELRRLAVRLNDANWSSDEARTQALRPYMLPIMQATATDEQRAAIRFKLADIAVREIVPKSLERTGRADLSATLRGLPEIVDAKSVTIARAAATAAYAEASFAASRAAEPSYQSAYSAAAALAAASARAAYAAVRGDPGHYSAADAAYFAAYAADTAAAAANGDDAELAHWTRRLMDAALALCGRKESGS